ncbi:hypothetical protein GVanDAA622_20820 [Enterococcus faecium]|nr:hypothetical protein GVanDAA622_20820 [Enterococcus faecium]
MKLIFVLYAMHTIIPRQPMKDKDEKRVPFELRGHSVKLTDNRCLLILVQITVVKRHKGNYK